MNSQQSQYKALVEALLPDDLFHYFEITDVKIREKEIQVDLDELNTPPASQQNVKLISKGFHAASAPRLSKAATWGSLS